MNMNNGGLVASHRIDRVCAETKFWIHFICLFSIKQQHEQTNTVCRSIWFILEV